MFKMKKAAFATLIVSTIFAFGITGNTFAAMPDATHTTNTKPHVVAELTIPSRAVEVAPHVFSLGNAIDAHTGNVVEGYMIVHRKEGKEKIASRGGSAGKTICYGYLAAGAKWKSVEPWIMNPINSDGVDTATAFSLVGGGINKWETASSANILGNGETTSAVLSADSAAPDNHNEVYFGSIADADAIAVTTVWGRFSGPTKFRELVEWDMVFDEVKFDWATTGALDKMDFDNIATHELGHAAGMADLYNSCTEETMYGYGTEGETKKRSLNSGDIQGINALY